MFKSKRYSITLFMMVSWLLFGYFGIKNGTNMSEFAAYFAALSPFVIVYIYGEKKRPSNSHTPRENTCDCECVSENYGVDVENCKKQKK